MESKKEVEVELEEFATVEEDKEKEVQKKETKGKRFNKIFNLQAVTNVLTLLKFKIRLLPSLWERLHCENVSIQSLYTH